MADGTSLGWGIALGSRFKNDYSGNEVIEDAFRRKAAADAQKEKDAVSRLDFKIDYNKFYPVIGKAIADEEAKLYRQYALYKQQDKNTAFNRIQEDFIRAKQRIGQLAQTNDQYKAYESLDPTKFVREADLLKTINSQDATFDDLMKFRKPGYLNIGDNGEFSFKPVPHYKMESQYSNNEYDEEERTYYSIPVPGKKGFLSVRRPSDLTIQRKANERVKDPKFLENLYYFKPELQGDVEGTVRAAFEAEKSIAPIPVQDRGEVDLSNPSAASEKQNRKPTIVDVDSETFVADVPEKRYQQGSKTTAIPYMSYDKVINIPDAQTTTVLVDKDMAKINPQISEEKAVSFKPNNIIRSTNKKDKKGLFVLGTATVMVPGRPGSSTESQTKTFEIAVPYNSVRGTIKESYPDLSEVDALIEDVKPKNTTYKAKMTNKQGKTIYTDGEKWYDENGNAI